MKTITLAFGCDHAGIILKPFLLDFVKGLGYTVMNLGTNTSDSVDYPDFSCLVVQAVTSKKADFGVLICGSGIGMSISANRNPLIRAALCHHEYDARVARAHNNANILCLGARTIGVDLAKACLQTFLTTPFEGGRHQKRLDKINQCSDSILD